MRPGIVALDCLSVCVKCFSTGRHRAPLIRRSGSLPPHAKFYFFPKFDEKCCLCVRGPKQDLNQTADGAFPCDASHGEELEPLYGILSSYTFAIYPSFFVRRPLGGIVVVGEYPPYGCNTGVVARSRDEEKKKKED